MCKEMTSTNKDGRYTGLSGAAGSATTSTILNQGYIIELADGGPWLKNDLTWTPIWDERGIWHELIDAELAMARSLLPNAAYQPRGGQAHE